MRFGKSAWAVVACVAMMAAGGADWPRFRGPAGAGGSDEAIPLHWSAAEGVRWKTALPGPGASSPIVSGEHVFLTCYSGYGVDPDRPGDPTSLALHVLCIDRKTGKILWDRVTPAGKPAQNYRGFVALHGYASATPVTDGQRVYTFFGQYGVMAYSTSGRLEWRASVGAGRHHWGSGASPILVDNLLVVNASAESQSVVALDKRTGQPVWRAGGVRESWSTPLVVTLGDGRRELVVSAHGWALGLEPGSGKELWRCHSVDDYVCPAVVVHGDVVFISSGRRPVTVAIRCGGRGAVSKKHVLWELNKPPSVPTPLYYDGHLYWADGRRGSAVCIDAATGQVVYEKRLSGLGKSYGSMVRAGDVLVAFTREEGAVVLAARPEFEELARNDLGDTSTFNGTPALDGGQLFVRSDRFLYCLGR